MNVVYVVQAGEAGPVKVGVATDRGLKRTIAALQRGNAEVLHVRQVLDGDERLERDLYVRLREHYLRDGWYAAAILDELQFATPVKDFDYEEEERRVALLMIHEINDTP
jgi:hypothetical protein